MTNAVKTAKHISMPVRVAIVEDDPALRSMLTGWLTDDAGIEIVGQYATAESALEAVIPTRPDVVLMDINLPGMNGIECVYRLKPQMPQTQFLMLTVYEDTQRIFQALAAGATGYLLKRASREELLNALEDVHRGGSPMTCNIARKVVQSFTQAAPSMPESGQLSAREQQVLHLMARGYLSKEIADNLEVSKPTVNTYIRRIYEKLQVHTRAQAVAKYLGGAPAR